ncbi:MAG: hypothetical protein JO131_04655, partial [Gammaproteobacteria bacterium]|nr:hypothetical protein [Gammaproteobacteria bacterium]
KQPLKNKLAEILKSEQSDIYKLHLIIQEVYRSSASDISLKNIKKELNDTCKYDEIYKALEEIANESKKIPLIQDMLKETKKYSSYLSTEKITPLEKPALINKLFSNEKKLDKYKQEKKHIENFQTTLETICNNISNNEYKTLKADFENFRENFTQWKLHLKDRIASSSPDKVGKALYVQKMQENIDALSDILGLSQELNAKNSNHKLGK